MKPKCATAGATLRVGVAKHIANNVNQYRYLWVPDLGDKGSTALKEDGDIPTDWES